MRTRRFPITTGLLIRIQRFEVHVGKEKVVVVENAHVGIFQKMLNDFMRRVAACLYPLRGQTQAIKDSFLEGCFWEVYYESGKTTKWDFWEILTGTEKPDKNAGFQNIHAKRIRKAYYGRLYRARKKGLKPF